MRKTAVFVALLAAFAAGQVPPVTRVFRPGHSPAPEDLRDIVNAMRATSDVRQGTIESNGSVTVQGTADQVALAEWVFLELEKPLATPPPPREYRVADDDIVRVLYLAHAAYPQHLQEMATNVRATADIRRVFTNAARRALVVRGTVREIGMAEWLVSELDRPPGLVAPHGRYSVPGATDDVLRVFYLRRVRTPMELQEMATNVRATTDLRRVFTSSARTAVVARGSVNQIAMAEWLVNELDKPAGQPPSGAPEYRMPAAGDDVVRVFYPTNIRAPQELQEIATAIRVTAGIRRVFTCVGRAAIVARGTTDQIAQAESLITKAR